MARPTFQEGPFKDTHVASGAALIATTAEALWIAADFTFIGANEPKAGRIFAIKAGGILSTGASGTLILIPQYGVLGGTTMGTSQTVTVPINMVNVPWTLEMEVVFRTIGAAGSATSTCIGTGKFCSAPFASAPAAGVSFVVPFGGTSATVDTSANSGITISKTLSVAGSITTQFAFGFWRN